jgi:hypothetical protein
MGEINGARFTGHGLKLPVLRDLIAPRRKWFSFSKLNTFNGC